MPRKIRFYLDEQVSKSIQSGLVRRGLIFELIILSNSKIMRSFLMFYLLCFTLSTFVACNEGSKGTANTPATSEKPTDPAESDLAAITEVVHGFFKWYETFLQDEKRNIDYLDSKGKATKLDHTKLKAYHTELIKSGFISKTYIADDMAYLKGYEAEWQKNNENASESPISGVDFDRVFCGQDWDIEAYTKGDVEVDELGKNQVKVEVGYSILELVKENGKWLIAKISCE